jgi:acyl carrier protein
MTNLQETTEQILGLAAAQFKVPRAQLAPDDDLFDKLDIDSLEAGELLTSIEEHFHIELPDFELEGVANFRTLAERIQARL